MRRKKELAEARAWITSLEIRLEIAQECAKRDSERMTELGRQRWLAVDALDDAQAELAAVNKECSALREERDRLKADLARACHPAEVEGFRQLIAKRDRHITGQAAEIATLRVDLELAQAEADYWRKRTVALTPPNPKVSGLLREGMKEGKGWTLEPLKYTAPQALTPLKSNPSGAAFGKVDLDWDFLVEEAGRHLKMALLRATNTSAPEHDQIHPFTD